jgi:outer membrane murein-binding lipoprotein Lpp
LLINEYLGTRGLRYITSFYNGFIILAVVLACLAVCGCDEVTPTPVPTTQGPSMDAMMADFGIYDEPATTDDLASSRNTLNAAVDALERGDKTAFLGTLSSDLMPAFEADDSLARPAALADAIRRAVVAESYRTAIVYTTVVNGKTFEIILVPEDRTWKIDEL